MSYSPIIGRYLYSVPIKGNDLGPGISAKGLILLLKCLIVLSTTIVLLFYHELYCLLRWICSVTTLVNVTSLRQLFLLMVHQLS